MSTGQARALSKTDVELLKRLLSNPLQIPAEFKAWLVSYLGPELQITQSQVVSATTAVSSGTGSPESIFAGGVGSVYLRTDGSAGTTAYFKESGTGTTGWVQRDVFTNGLTVSDGKDITISSGTGTKIGQASSKIGFFNATPVAKQGSTTDLKDTLVNLGVLTDGGATPLNLDAGALSAGAVTIADGSDVTIGTSTGTKIGQAASKIGFFNATPAAKPSAFTQTYSTADRTLSAYTPDTETVAYTGAADSEAKLADLNALRVAYENLRLFTEDLAQLVNALVDDHQTLGLAS